MKVLVVGGGGREHAICWKLAQSPRVTELYCAPGNGGIAQVAKCVPIKATDVEGMVQWARENAMDFVMVAPDDPLALGMVDALEAAGISVVRRWVEAELRVPYSLFERARQETEAAGGLVDGAEYGADVTLRVLLPEEKATGFTDRITELTAGGVVPAVTGESFKDVPRAGII